MALNKMFFRKYGMIGTGYGIIAWLLSLIYSILPTGGTTQSSLSLAPIAEGVKSQIKTGLSQDLLTKILGYLNGLPIDFVSLFWLILSGITIALVGGFFVEMISRSKVKKPTVRLILVGVIGTFVSGLIVGFLNQQSLQVPPLNMAFVMTIYFTIVSFMYGLVASWSKGTQLKKIFIEA